MLRYVKTYRDRHGKVRHYFRRKGCKTAALPGLPGSVEFMAAYQAALGEPAKPLGPSRLKPGSISALIVDYYASADFQILRPSTQRGYKANLEPFRDTYGHLGVASMTAEHIRLVLDKHAATPAQAANLRKRLRQLMQFAAERGWRKDNPVLVIRRDKRKVEGFIPWSEAEIAAYEARWPSGTRERLAMALLLYTGQRRSDVVSMGRQHVREGRIHVRQVKTDRRLAISLHPALQVEIDAAPKDQLTFLQTQLGAPFSPAGFTGWFVERAKLAGVKDRSPHGLRKAAGRRLAEAGCSAQQIMAILGHQSMQEADRYTRDVDQARLGDDAIAALVRTEG